MNKQRRKEIAALIGKIEEISIAVAEVHDDEEEYRNNLPESMREGQRGQKSQEAIDALYDAVQSLDYVIENLVQAKE